MHYRIFCKIPLVLPPIQEIEEFFSRLSARPHAAQHTARHGRSGRLFYSPHDHAQMARLHDNGNALRFQYFSDC